MERTHKELLDYIFNHISEIATYKDHKKIFYAFAEMCREIVYADRCTIWMLDKKEERIWTNVVQGLSFISLDADSGIVGTAIQNDESVITNNVYNDSRFNEQVDAISGYRTETMMVVPLKERSGEVVGALQVINKQSNEKFSQNDLQYLQYIGTYISETILATLEFEEMNSTQNELIYILCAIGESRTREMTEHIKRVADISYLFAELYGLSAKECHTIRMIAPLHDIGKAMISDKVLSKPDRLNSIERTYVMTHASKGYDILKGSERETIQLAAIVAHQHHEKYDGTGYPSRLAGEDIHIFGRIVALADVFDALCAKRSYKEAWSYDEVVSYIETERGKHFDPKLVDLFLSHKDKFFETRKNQQLKVRVA